MPHVKLCAILIGLLCYLLSPFALAVPASCKEQHLNPSLPDTRKPLDWFYNQGRGDCWVHTDDSELNFVITGMTANNAPLSPQQQTFIDKALQAIQHSRQVLDKLAPMNFKIYIVFIPRTVETESETGLAYFPDRASNECWAEVYSGGRSLAEPDWTSFLIAHEIAHCFSFYNIHHSSYNVFERNFDRDEWREESVADWLANIIYPKANYEFRHTQKFDLTSRDFKQPYKANWLFSEYARKHGDYATVRFAKDILDHQRIQQLSQFLARTDYNTLFHDSYLGLLDHNLPDLGGGLITKSAEAITELPSIQLDDSRQQILIPQLPQGRLNIISVTLPASKIIKFNSLADPSVQLTIEPSPSQRFRPTETEQWLKSQCNREQSIKLYLTHLNEQDLRKIPLSYEVKPDEACTCDFKKPIIDKCLIGSWQLDNKHLVDYILNYPNTPPDLKIENYEDSQITTTFTQQGLGSSDDTVSYKFTSGFGLDMSILSSSVSSEKFAYTTRSTNGTTIMCTKILDSTLKGSMTLLPSGVSEPMKNFPDIGHIEDNIAYSCKGNELMFLAPPPLPSFRFLRTGF